MLPIKKYIATNCRQDVRQNFPCLRSARMLSRISSLNKSPIDQSRSRCFSTSRCYFSHSWQLSQKVSNIRHFFPLHRWGDRRHLNTCFCASYVLFCQEKEIFNFNGVQALEFLALWVKDLMNWSFDVRVSRGENDARSANCREPSDSAADKQQRQKSKLLRK